MDGAPVAEQGAHLPAVDAAVVDHHLAHYLPHLQQVLVPQVVPHHRLGDLGYRRCRRYVQTDIVDPSMGGEPFPGIKHFVILNQLSQRLPNTLSVTHKLFYELQMSTDMRSPMFS